MKNKFKRVMLFILLKIIWTYFSENVEETIYEMDKTETGRVYCYRWTKEINDLILKNKKDE